MLRLAWLCAAIGLLPSTLAAQPPADSTSRPAGLILGRVVDASSGRPVPMAIVAINPGAGRASAATRRLTDANGEFVFRDLPNGQYTLQATKGGYADGAYGRKVPYGQAAPIVLSDSDRTIDTTVLMWKTSSIAGSVVDEAGEPIVNVAVRGYRRSSRAGGWWLVSMGTAVTDDRGAYRMWNLPPGEYVVGIESTSVTVPVSVADAYEQGLRTSAPGQNPLSMLMFEAGAIGVLSAGNTARSGPLVRTLGRGPVPPPLPETGRGFTYPTTFHPSAPTSAQATAVALGSGEERTAVDIQVAPTPSARVTGTVQGPDGAVPHALVKLVPAGADGLFAEIETSTTITDPSGAFTLLGIPPGQYTLRVTTIPLRAPGAATSSVVQVGSMTMATSVVTSGNEPGSAVPSILWATMPLSVGTRDIAGLELQVRPGLRVSGRFEFDGTAEGPPGKQITGMVWLEPASGRGPVRAERASLDADGNFMTRSVPAGRYFLRLGGPPGWHLRVATIEGKDITDTPFDLESDLKGVVATFTDRATDLTGTVTTASGSPDGDAVVLLFPSEPASWREWGLMPRRMRSTRTTSGGTYSFPALPPGDYYVIALPAEDALDWQDARRLAVLAQDATAITLREGEQNRRDLRAAAGTR